MPTESQLNSTLLEAALSGLQAQRERVVEHIAEVNRLLGHRGARRAVAASEEAVATPAEGAVRSKRRRMSAAGRKAIAEAQKKRWAAHKAAGQAPAETPRRKRKMSAAARKRIGDATRKRWAEYRKKQK